VKRKGNGGGRKRSSREGKGSNPKEKEEKDQNDTQTNHHGKKKTGCIQAKTYVTDVMLAIFFQKKGGVPKKAKNRRKEGKPTDPGRKKEKKKKRGKPKNTYPKRS